MLDPRHESSAAISIYNAKNIEISHLKISNTVGGIYVFGNHVIIKKNELNQVNMGNIVVSGTCIKVEDNIISESGKSTSFMPSSGDAISVEGGSSDVEITRNIIDTGYCVLIWAHPFVDNIKIMRNILKSGITTAVIIEGGTNIIVSDNEFVSNLSYGLGISTGSADVLVENNNFYDNGVFVSSDVEKILIQYNTLIGTPPDTKLIEVGNNVMLGDNEIVDTPIGAAPQLELRSSLSDTNIQMGDIVEFDVSTEKVLIFQMKNVGNQVIGFRGIPQVLLSDKILPADDRGFNPNGTSIFAGLAVEAWMQPTKLTLQPNESTKFAVNTTGSIGKSVRVNVPTNFVNYKPFWFILKPLRAHG